MKNRCILFFLLLPLLGYSQSLEIDWQTCHGGPTHDQAYDMVAVEDGYILTGRTKRDGYTDLSLLNLIWKEV